MQMEDEEDPWAGVGMDEAEKFCQVHPRLWRDRRKLQATQKRSRTNSERSETRSRRTPENCLGDQSTVQETLLGEIGHDEKWS